MTRVLIAEDNELLRTGISALLRNMPPDVVAVAGEARSGREVLNAMGNVPPDVVLMDIGMPDIIQSPWMAGVVVEEIERHLNCNQNVSKIGPINLAPFMSNTISLPNSVRKIRNDTFGHEDFPVDL